MVTVTWFSQYMYFDLDNLTCYIPTVLFQGYCHKLCPVYPLVPREWCDHSIWWITVYETRTAIPSNTSSHRYILIKTEFIIIAFHLRRPIAVAQRETLHVFCHTAITSFTIFWLFELTFNWLIQDLPQFPPLFFFSPPPHTLCNLPVWPARFHNPSISPSTCELNCHPERGDSTFIQCHSFIIQPRTLSFEKMIAVASTHCVGIGDMLYCNILLKIRKSYAL